VYAQVSDSGEEGGDGAEGGEAVAKLDGEAADGLAVDVAHLRREVAREEEEVAERLEGELGVVWAGPARGAEGAHEGEVRDGEVFEVGQGALAEDDVVGARPRQVLDRRVRLEELLRVLVRVERPAPAQVEFQEGGKSTVVQQGGDFRGVADEMWQMKDLPGRGEGSRAVLDTCETAIGLERKTDLQTRAGQEGVTKRTDVFFIPRHSGEHGRLEIRELPNHLRFEYRMCQDEDGEVKCAYLEILEVSVDLSHA
jgi:hypothetical protein